MKCQVCSVTVPRHDLAAHKVHARRIRDLRQQLGTTNAAIEREAKRIYAENAALRQTVVDLRAENGRLRGENTALRAGLRAELAAGEAT